MLTIQSQCIIKEQDIDPSPPASLTRGWGWRGVTIKHELINGQVYVAILWQANLFLGNNTVFKDRIRQIILQSIIQIEYF